MASFLLDLVPPGSPLHEVWKPERLRSVAVHLLRKQWVARLIEDAREEGAEFYAFKGCGIAHLPQVYAFPYLRPLGDVDLLVRKEDLPGALRAAQAGGFRFLSDDPAVLEYQLEEFYHVPLEHDRYGSLEVHYDLYRDIPSAVVVEALERAVPASIYDCPVHALRSPDLLLFLMTHLATTTASPLWVWLLDILRLAESLSPEEWEELCRTSLACGAQVFVHATLGCLRELWQAVPHGMPDAFPRCIADSLSVRERKAVDNLLVRLPAGPFDGDRLSMARRLSGRPVRGGKGHRSSLICHPGVVCLELSVRSDAPRFWWHRIRHIVLRARRGLAAASPERRPAISPE